MDSLLSLPNDTFNFVTLPGRRTVTVDDVAGASPTIKALAANVQGHTWNSLDLIETLVTLGDSDVADTRTSVRELLDKGVRISAELVHMGLLQVPVSYELSCVPDRDLTLFVRNLGEQLNMNIPKSCWACFLRGIPITNSSS